MAHLKELTKGIGADSVLGCVGTQESMTQAIRSTRKGGYLGYVDVPQEAELNSSNCSTLTSTSTVGQPQCAAPCPS